MAERTTAILVLGMHRSGTSATAGWLQTLGVNLGTHLMAGDLTQPKGYFEHVEITGIHDELMAAFDSSWDDPRSLPEGWEHDHKVQLFRRQLMEVIRRDFMVHQLWGVKDPRLCRLLPIWLMVLGELDVPVRVIFVLRHPAEVAESLALRNGFSAEKSGLLWLRYLLEAERHSRRIPRTTLQYSDLLLDSRTQSQRVAQILGIAWPTPIDESAAAVNHFLESGLRHHKTVHFDRFPPPLRRWIVSTYRALKPSHTVREDGQAMLDSVRCELEPYDSYVAACWLERTRNIGLQNAHNRAILLQLQAQFCQSQADVVQARADLKSAQSALAQAQSEFAQVQSEFAQVQSEFAQVQSEVAQAQSEVAQAQSEVVQAKSEVASLRADLDQKNDKLVKTEVQLARALTDLANSGAASKQVNAELAQARMNLEQTRGELETLLRSRYWRVTRPWRTFDAYLRTMRHRRRERKRRRREGRNLARPLN